MLPVHEITAALLTPGDLSDRVRQDAARWLLQLTSTDRMAYDAGPLHIDVPRRYVTKNGKHLPLTSAQFVILLELARAAPAPAARSDLHAAALSGAWHAESRSVDQLVFSLRPKLKERGQPQPLMSVRGRGYVLAYPIDAELRPPPLTRAELLLAALPLEDRPEHPEAELPVVTRSLAGMTLAAE